MPESEFFFAMKSVCQNPETLQGAESDCLLVILLQHIFPSNSEHVIDSCIRVRKLSDVRRAPAHSQEYSCA